MEPSNKVRSRYEIREVLGRGGMGIVYKAFDLLMKREVALKTILEVHDKPSLELFFKEWGALSSIVHPNIVEIFDIGEVEEEGKARPYFVMPLLPGTTLDNLIKESSHRLTIERVVDIICQTCRGLQVAHERGLIHRDLKPSNIFVMQDDSVKIIDFGVAHLAESESRTGLKGTLAYMAPEQIELKTPTASSDIFSLGVTCYEAITGRRPFVAQNEVDLAQAITTENPVSASEVNPAVSQALSQAIHKALAKQPWHRYASAKEFSETLQRALRGEPIEFFDPSKVTPRLEKAAKALERGEYSFASEIIAEIEAEGHVDPAIGLMRRQIDQAVRQATIVKLLENARRCFEEQEFSLGLRKIQDALILDPENHDALALKSQVERERRERKADEWMALAREHAANGAFTQARIALKSLMEVRPGDTGAIEMGAELDRKESDVERLRQERDQLQKSAMDAWDRGDVSAALIRLEKAAVLNERVPEGETPNRASFRSFYQTVRSEHDAIRNAYETARTHLNADELDQALTLCDQYLAKYPNHALFQALKFDVEERQRQRLSMLIAEIDRRVDAEPDLDKRVSIVEEALRQYPREPHFERALRVVRDKRDLVNSIVSKARYLEEQGQIPEALDQWKVLRTIHSEYPALQVELERLAKRRDHHTRAESKARWVAQIDRQLESGNFSGALDSAEQALVEFPDDDELAEIRRLAEQGVARDVEARKLMEQGQALVAADRFDDGIDLLGRAFEMNERNRVTRAVLTETLVQKARELIQTDWKEAEILVQQVLELDSQNALGKSLRASITDHKREEYITTATAEARRRRASGDIQGAKEIADQAARDYPKDPRVAQLQAALQRDLDASSVQERAKDLVTLKQLHQTAMTVRSAQDAEAISVQAREIGQKYPTDAEVRGAAAAILKQLAQSSVGKRRGPAAVPPPEIQTQAMPPSSETETKATIGDATAKEPMRAMGPETIAASEVDTRTAAKTPPPEVEPTPPETPDAPLPAPPPVVPPKPRTVPAVPFQLNQRQVAIALVVAISLLLLLAGGVYLFKRRPATPTVAKLVVRTVPAGAQIVIAGANKGLAGNEIDLPPGEYEVTAELDGFQPAKAQVKTDLEKRAEITLTLVPLPAMLRLFAEIEDAKMSLDGGEPLPVENGESNITNLVPGSHSIQVSGKGASAVVAFEGRAGNAPLVTANPEVNGVAAYTIATYRGAAALRCNCGNSKVALDSSDAGQTSEGSLDLSNVAPGLHELVIGEGDSAKKLLLDMGQAPALYVYLKSDRQVGTVVISALDGASVFFNNRKVPRTTFRDNKIRFIGIPAGHYTIRVEKEGYDTPPAQTIDLKKGDELALNFELQASVKESELLLVGAMPMLQVWANNTQVGRTDAAGRFSTKLPPGNYTIELRKAGYRTRTLKKELPNGQIVELTPDEMAMESSLAKVVIKANPAGARVRFLPNGDDTRGINATGATTSIEEGRYSVTARLEGYRDWSAPLTIEAGETKTVDIKLDPLRDDQKPAQGKRQGTMRDFGGKWITDGAWWVHRGGEFVLYNSDAPVGSFVMTAYVRKGKKLQWVARYKDPKNYVLYEMDKVHVTISNVVNGKENKVDEVSHGQTRSETFTFRMDLTPGFARFSVREGNEWKLLNTVRDTQQPAFVGRFGFLIPGRDEFAVTNFGFYPY